jgi:integrase
VDGPLLGGLPLAAIDAPAVLGCLRAIEARGALETARRVRQRVSAVFCYAIACGMASADPAAMVRGAMAPMKKGRQPAVTQLEPLRELLRAAESVPAHPGTRLALRFLALTAVRPGELREVSWGEFEALDGDALWRVPAGRMKMRVEHLVPLSRQAVEVLAAMRRISGRNPFVFPNVRHPLKPLSENALGYLINRAGYHGRHVPHGFRAAYSTIMNERFMADRHVIDIMLAHAPPGDSEWDYNRAVYLPRRRVLAQEWADLLLDGFRPAGELVGLAQR